MSYVLVKSLQVFSYVYSYQECSKFSYKTKFVWTHLTISYVRSKYIRHRYVATALLYTLCKFAVNWEIFMYENINVLNVHVNKFSLVSH